MKILLRVLANAMAVLAGAYVLGGVRVKDFTTALVVAVVLGALNTFLKPILIFLTLPITLVTLGLFLLVINAGLVMLAARIVPGFEVESFGWALLYGLALSVINSFLQPFD